MDDWNLPSIFDFDGQAVRYCVVGSGEPLVLVHGTPFSSVVWRRLIPALSAERRLHIYDLLGYGQSEKRHDQDVSLGIQNHLLRRLLEHWRIERPEVIAHDFGGATALRAHLLDGCEYRSLLLVDPVAIRPWGSAFVQHVRQHEPAFSAMPAYIHHAIIEAYIAGAAYLPLTPDVMRLYTTPWQGDMGQSAFYRQIAQMDQRYTDEITDALGRIRCPVTLLWGTEDAWIPLQRGIELAGRMQVDLVPVPRSGHLMQEDAPDAIIAAWRRSFA